MSGQFSPFEDMDQVWTEALVENNTRKLDGFFDEIATEYMGELAILTGQDKSLIALDQAAHERFAHRASIVQAAADGLPSRIERIRELVQIHRITAPIDRTFVDETILFLDISQLEPQDEEATTEFIQSAVEALATRISEREVIAASEIHSPVSLSNNRQMTIIVSGESARLELPFVTNPDEFPVAIGPNAVIEILGAKLTDEDYAQISQTLLYLPGAVGEASQVYAAAIESWAQAVESGNEADEIESVRRRRDASAELNRVFAFSQHSDIPIYALSTTIIRQHPQLDYMETPQPYTS